VKTTQRRCEWCGVAATQWPCEGCVIKWEEAGAAMCEPQVIYGSHDDRPCQICGEAHCPGHSREDAAAEEVYAILTCAGYCWDDVNEVRSLAEGVYQSYGLPLPKPGADPWLDGWLKRDTQPSGDSHTIRRCGYCGEAHSYCYCPHKPDTQLEDDVRVSDDDCPF
jgi:hypothetical protein